MKTEKCIQFKHILSATDFSPVLVCDCPNEAYNKFIYSNFLLKPPYLVIYKPYIVSTVGADSNCVEEYNNNNNNNIFLYFV